MLWLPMPSLEPIFDFVFTDHALIEMARREITGRMCEMCWQILNKGRLKSIGDKP
jgi:hypothetical protein